MKHHILAVSLVDLFTVPAVAQSCTEYGSFSRMFMESRQMGMPLDYALSFFDSYEDLTEEQERNLRLMMTAAFDQPVEETEEAKLAAVDRFEISMEITCKTGFK
jgi:hypothetical protein